jgi:hypothetical protein
VIEKQSALKQAVEKQAALREGLTKPQTTNIPVTTSTTPAATATSSSIPVPATSTTTASTVTTEDTKATEALLHQISILTSAHESLKLESAATRHKFESELKLSKDTILQLQKQIADDADAKT